MNPVFKRFLKGLGATVFASILMAVLHYAITAVPTLGVVPTAYTGIVIAALLALEKSIPNNL